MKRPATVFTFFLLLCSGIGSATATGLPPVSEVSGNQRNGEFVWFDLITNDLSKARTYYEGLFGWEIRRAKGHPGYALVSNRGATIGGIAEVPGEEQAAWFGLVSVSDVAKGADQVTQLGGRVLEPVQEVEGRGVMALVEDSTGAAFVLLDTGGRDPEHGATGLGDWMWVDLFVRDPKAAGDFYQALVGLELRTFKEGQAQVNMLVAGGRAQAGVVEIPWEHVTPAWLPYVQVADVGATIKRSTQLGGRLFVEFDDGAILLDPTGAAIGIQKATN